MTRRTISLLGSTGSIGRQSLDVIAACDMQVAALTANRDVGKMEEQCRRFAPALAVMMDEHAAADLRALSPREKQIFRLLADGKSVKAIAGELFISPKTVETHKYNLLTKLKAASVGDLVKIAIRHGLVKV